MKKKFVLCLSLLATACICFGCGDGTKTDTDNKTEIKVEEKKENSGNYYDYIQNELIPQYGLSELNQEGQADLSYPDCFPNGEWLNPTGIVSASIDDFNGDGEKDMLLIRFVEQGVDEYSQKKLFVPQMEFYTMEDKTVTKKSELKLYYEEKNQGYSYEKTFSAIETLNVRYSIAKIDSYFIIEDCRNGVISDGLQKNYWILTLDSDEIYPIAGFIQTGGGSTSFAFSQKQLDKNWNPVREILLFADEDAEIDNENPKYASFEEALTAFFSEYGISINSTSLDDTESVIPENHILDYNVDGDYHGAFKLDVTDYTNLRENIN